MEQDKAPLVYGLTKKARSVDAVTGDTESNRFVVATCSLREANELHVVSVDAEATSIKVDSVYAHEHEVWGVRTVASNASQLFTVYNTASKASTEKRRSFFAASLWTLNDGDGSSPSLTKELDLGEHVGRIHDLVLDPDSQEGGTPLTRVATLDDEALRVWDVSGESSSTPVHSWSVDQPGITRPSGLAWDPHLSNQLLMTHDRDVQCFDLRSKSEAFAIKNAHRTFTRSVDCNPNRPYVFATCGDDCMIRFWDSRRAQQPVQTLGQHSHWVWNVLYNRFHDQLLISSSTDNTVQLWQAPSVSSNAADAGGGVSSDSPAAGRGSGEGRGGGGMGGATGLKQDCKLCTYSDHEDSVYSVAWSAYDAYLFASVSFDGRLVVCQVPQAVQFEILGVV